MSTAAALPQSEPKSGQETWSIPNSADYVYRLSVPQYEQMVQLGLLTKDDRVELIEGQLVKKMTKNELHVATTKRVCRILERSIPQGWHIAKEDPIALPRSVPEPDAAVIRGDGDDYVSRKPGPGDVALIVEVADSSYAYDRSKRTVYAEAGLPHYWLVNIPGRRLEAHEQPTGPDAAPDYKKRQDYGLDEAVPLVIDGREVARIAVRDLFPPEIVDRG